MSQTIQEENKALVLEAFDTLFNSRDTPRPSPGPASSTSSSCRL